MSDMSDQLIKCDASLNFDQPTLAEINKIRFTENIEGVEEYPYFFPQGEVSYRLNNYTKDILKEPHQDRAVTIALRAWQTHLRHLRFRREYNKDVTVDADISFEDLEHFHGKKGTLAHAILPGQGPTSGDVHINDDWHWVTHSKLQTLSKPPLVPILIHEFGHSILGLRHDTLEPNAIMYPSFNLGVRKNKLHRRDIYRGQERYGKRTIPQWILNYLLRRRDNGWDFR